MMQLSEEVESTLQTDEITSARISYFMLIKEIANKLNIELSHKDHNIEKMFEKFTRTKRVIFKIDLSYILENPDVLEVIYDSIVPARYRKNFGQFFTPPAVAKFMADWVLENEGTDTILDPAVGTGIFPSKIIEHLKVKDKIGRPTFCGIDLDPLMLNAAEIKINIANSDKLDIKLISGDFLKTSPLNGVCGITKFDALICNPPYLKFHGFDREIISLFEKEHGLRLSKLTNIFTLFFIHAYYFLKDGGKMVFITPSEFLSTRYGEVLKKFFICNTKIEAFILFDVEEVIFNKGLTTACITLLRKERGKGDNKVKFVRVKEGVNLDRLLECLKQGKSSSGIKITEVCQKSLKPENKWMRYFENHDLKYLEKLPRLKKIAKVDRGIATGHNQFFTLSRADVKKWEIEEKFLKPVISKATQCQSIEFNESDFERLKAKNEKMYLLYCFEIPTRNLQRYIEYGKSLGVDKRYLTLHRKPWYSMERKKSAPILATVFSRKKMRFIFNKVEALNLAAFHCIYPNFEDEKMIKALLAYFVSDISKELMTIERRVYGGGLYKFEPRDLENIPVIDVARLDLSTLARLANLFDNFVNAEKHNDERGEKKAKEEINMIVKEIIETLR